MPDTMTTAGGITLGAGAAIGLTGIGLHYAGTHNPTDTDIAGLRQTMDTAQAGYAATIDPGPRLPSDADAVVAAKQLLTQPVTAWATNGREQPVSMTSLVDERVWPDADTALQHGWAHGEGRAVTLLQPGSGQYLVAHTADALTPFHDSHSETRTVTWTTSRTVSYTDAQGKSQTRTETDFHSASVPVREDTVEHFHQFRANDRHVAGMVHPSRARLENLGTPEQNAAKETLDHASSAWEAAVADVARAPAQLQAANITRPLGLVVALAGAGALAYGLLHRDDHA